MHACVRDISSRALINTSHPALIISGVLSPSLGLCTFERNIVPPNIIYLATIAQDNYPAFRSLPGNDFYNTYDEWLKLLDNQATHYRALRNTIVYVRINADEFTHFCASKSTPHNLNSLYSLAAEKGRRQQN
jgi:hypothetical protein